jgi:hypothetical protein
MPEVDRSFMRDLKLMDSRLSVKFNGQHHVITFDRGHGEPVNILRIKAEDGGYRQPDRRDIAIIKGGDLAEGEPLESRLKKKAYISEEMRKQLRKKQHDEIRDQTRDNKLQLKRWVNDRANQSKGNAEFRRIPHKAGKNVVVTA